MQALLAISLFFRDFVKFSLFHELYARLVVVVSSLS